MLPTPSDVHVNRPLTNILIAFMQDASEFVATQVFQNIPVQKQSDSFFTYDRGYFYRDEMTKRAPATESSGGGYGVSTDNYRCDVFAHHKDIADQLRANADAPINLEMDATNWLGQLAMIRKEKQFVTDFFSGGIWTSYDYDGVAGAPSANEFRQWDDFTNSDPIVDIRTAKTALKKLTGFKPNVMVFSEEVWDKIQDHPQVLERLKFGSNNANPARVSKEAVAAILELDEVLVAGAVENTANEGQTNSFDFIGGKKALLLYRPPAPGVLVPAAGYTFSWNGHLGAGALGGRIKKFRLEREAADRVEIEIAFDMKLISVDMGAFFDSAVA